MALVDEVLGVSWFTNTTIFLVSLGLAWSLVRNSGPYNRFPRVGLPWYLSLLSSKPVYKLVEDGLQLFYDDSNMQILTIWIS
ncbi:hypothetical protein F4859DRAFT_484524 [Xylaria cf. heliscus]|nr:hypothetical protein F4859DRAFT_484524 [Xylaria cf. heliscus]